MNIRRAINGIRTNTAARPGSLALFLVAALLLPTLFLSVGATDTEAAPIPMAPAEVLYGVVPDGGDSRLVTLDPTDGSVLTDVGLITDAGLNAFAAVTGLAFADHDMLFAVSSDSVLKIDLSDQIFPNFVVATKLNILTDPVHDLDFDDGVPRVLFGIQDLPDSEGNPVPTLVTIDTGSGAVSPVGATGGRFGPGNGLAFASDGKLFNASGEVMVFGFDPAFPILLGAIDWQQLNESTGAGTLPLPNPVTFSSGADFVGRISSMALRPGPDGTLFGSLNVMKFSDPDADHFLVTIDTSGVVTKVGDPTPTTKGLDGLAFRPPPVGGGGPVVFASFEVTKLDLKKKNGDFHIHAKFRLGAGNNDVDILGEPFTFQVINPDNDEILFELNLPDAGGVSFSEKRTNKFQYKAHNKSTKERIDIKIDLKKNGEYKFHAKGKHADMNLDDLERNALVLVRLTIGDDSGDVSGVRAKIKK